MRDHEDEELARVTRVNEIVDANRVTGELATLRMDLSRMSLICQALWEMLERKLGVPEAELLALMNEIDLRDGKQDGRITRYAMRCPSCQRVCNSTHQRCMYCGQDFETDFINSTGR